MCANWKGKAHRQHERMFRINFELSNKYANRKKILFQRGAQLCCLGFYLMCTLKYLVDGGKLGVLGVYN